MRRLPVPAVALLALVAAVAFLAPPASAQIRPGKPGPDLSGYEALRAQIEAGHETVHWMRGASGRPAILLTGYWPPTNEMIRQFSDNPVQNPGGWMGADWEGRGYDIYAFFPEFPGGWTPPCDWGTGLGDLEVDYQDTSTDFWPIVDEVHPTAIITFGRGDAGNGWEVEIHQHNHRTWMNDYVAPTLPTPTPPDASWPRDGDRCSTLPVQDIADRVNAAALGFNAFVDETGDTGRFLCEYIAYHGTWYRALHAAPADPYRMIAAGHVHVGWQTCSDPLTPYVQATEETLRGLIALLDAGQEIPPNQLQARSTGPIEITLDWVGTSPSFEIYRADGGCAGTPVLIGTSDVPTFVDTNATEGQIYGYFVRALERCTADSSCIEVTHSPCDRAALNRIPDLTAVKATAGGIDLSWSEDPASPPEYHLNSVSVKTDLESPNRGRAEVLPECTVTTTSCTDLDAFATADPLYYEVLSACADQIGEEGPH